jgi:Glutathione S-transferase, N-terminal domain
MITVFGEGRGFRVVWLLEEMGLAYRLRPVNLLAGVEKDAEFLAINPAVSFRRFRTATSRWSSPLRSWNT